MPVLRWHLFLRDVWKPQSSLDRVLAAISLRTLILDSAAKHCLAWCLPTETLPFVATLGMCWVFLELGSLAELLALPQGPWISPGVAYAHALPAWSWEQRPPCCSENRLSQADMWPDFLCCSPIYRAVPPPCLTSLRDPQWWSSCFWTGEMVVLAHLYPRLARELLFASYHRHPGDYDFTYPSEWAGCTFLTEDQVDWEGLANQVVFWHYSSSKLITHMCWTLPPTQRWWQHFEPL